MKKHDLLRGLLVFTVAGLIGCAAPAEDLGQESAHSQSGSETPVAQKETESNTEQQYNTEVNQEVLHEHEQFRRNIMEEFEKGSYTFEEPLVVQDPYERSPLSALVLFETQQPAELTVTVGGKTEDTTVKHTVNGFQTVHQVPVLGLYPDTQNLVKFTAETEDGNKEEMTLTLTTNPLPDDMLDFTVTTAQPDKMEPGLTFVSPSRSYPTAVDHNGDVRWYSSQKTNNQLKRLENGNLLISTLEEANATHQFLEEMDMFGRVYQSIEIEMANSPASSPLHHDTIVLPNGNYLALMHDGSSEYVEDELAELDRYTGEVVHRINFKDVFPRSMYEDYDGFMAEVGDWLHVNTVWKLADEDAVLLSLRQQDSILKMSYPEGEIEWLFGYPEGWPEELEKYLLKPANETTKFPGGPHAVMELPDQDGDDATLDILLFDNNEVFTRGDQEASGTYSRAVQYRINEENKTVEEVWSYGEERGNEFFSRIVGDADQLPKTGNVLATSGYTYDEEKNQRYSVMVETTKTADSEVVFELKYGSFDEDEYLQIYRAERMPLYPSIISE